MLENGGIPVIHRADRLPLSHSRKARRRDRWVHKAEITIIRGFSTTKNWDKLRGDPDFQHIMVEVEGYWKPYTELFGQAAS